MNRIETVKFKSETAELNCLVAFIENICDENNIYNNYFGNIVTAVSEAFLNAINHGNHFDPNKKVSLRFETHNDGFSFGISDEGNGFNIHDVVDPTDINTTNEQSGRGLYIISSLSDNLSFSDNGKTIIMKFLISSITKEMADNRINLFKAFVKENVTVQ
jgi:serine/threonine-protein kinase RsbW